MAAPAFIFVIAFASAAYGSARWLPDRSSGPVGRLAFLTACCLLGVALALIGVEIYELVRNLDRVTSIDGIGNAKADVFAGGLAGIVRDAGPIIGLAAAVYLLAPTHR